MRALVTGAGGFIGGHLVHALEATGIGVRAVDMKPCADWYQWPRASQSEMLSVNLAERRSCEFVCQDVDEVYNLAADMGGIGFIEGNKARCMLSILISAHMLEAAHAAGVSRFFYSSSACVYPQGRQDRADVQPLREEEAYPAMPEDGYGWEKLFSERLCRHYLEDFHLPTRVARYHNAYGPHGTWDGGREKAPAAICRKVAIAALTGQHEIEIWGDGEQTRTFMYIDDCVQGTLLIARGAYPRPLNLGSSELVTVNELVSIVEGFAGVRVKRRYQLDAPHGVRGRSSDNTLIRRLYGWEPTISLRDGLERTYAWIYDRVRESGRWAGGSAARLTRALL